MFLWGIMMVRLAVSPGLDTKSQRFVCKTVQGLVHNYGGLLSKRPSLMSIFL
jgi:hypothetical protein